MNCHQHSHSQVPSLSWFFSGGLRASGRGRRPKPEHQRVQSSKKIQKMIDLKIVIIQNCTKIFVSNEGIQNPKMWIIRCCSRGGIREVFKTGLFASLSGIWNSDWRCCQRICHHRHRRQHYYNYNYNYNYNHNYNYYCNCHHHHCKDYRYHYHDAIMQLKIFRVVDKNLQYNFFDWKCPNIPPPPHGLFRKFIWFLTRSHP